MQPRVARGTRAVARAARPRAAACSRVAARARTSRSRCASQPLAAACSRVAARARRTATCACRTRPSAASSWRSKLAASLGDTLPPSASTRRAHCPSNARRSCTFASRSCCSCCWHAAREVPWIGPPPDAAVLLAFVDTLRNGRHARACGWVTERGQPRGREVREPREQQQLWGLGDAARAPLLARRRAARRGAREAAAPSTHRIEAAGFTVASLLPSRRTTRMHSAAASGKSRVAASGAQLSAPDSLAPVVRLRRRAPHR